MNETLAILEKVNAFYSNAWSQLIGFAIVIFGLVGIVVPGISQILQNRANKIDKKELQDFIQKKVSESNDLLKKEIEKNQVEQNKIISKKLAATNGASFHLQGLILIDKALYENAFNSLIIAADRYLIGDDEMNLRRVLEQMIACLSKMKKNGFEYEFAENKNSFIKLMESLDKNNDNGKFTDKIATLKASYQQAQSR